MIKSKKTIVFMLDNFIWVMLLGLILIGSFTIPQFFSAGNFMNILFNSNSFGLMVLGMTFCLLLGQLDLSIESTYAFGPAIATMCMTQWFGLDPIAAIFVTLGVGLAVGWANGMLSVKLGINPFLSTLCMMMILRGFVLFFIPQGVFYLDEKFLFLGSAKIDEIIPVAVVIFISLFVLAHIVLKKTPFGKNLVATGSNPRAAYLAGINVNKIKIISFVIAGLLAALGGLLLAGRMGSVTNGMGEGGIMQVLAAAILGGVSMNGGKGTAIGALGGIIFLTTISNVLNMSGVSPFLVQVIQGLILLAAIIFDNLKEKIYYSLIRI